PNARARSPPGPHPASRPRGPGADSARGRRPIRPAWRQRPRAVRPPAGRNRRLGGRPSPRDPPGTGSSGARFPASPTKAPTCAPRHLPRHLGAHRAETPERLRGNAEELLLRLVRVRDDASTIVTGAPGGRDQGGPDAPSREGLRGRDRETVLEERLPHRLGKG